MSPRDPRSRIALHMNWKGQTLPILLGGLPRKADTYYNGKDWHSLPQPSVEEIASISPFAQIFRGRYRTPTFLVHGTEDDLIPWEQTKKVHEALVGRGVLAGCAVVQGAPHLFDLGPDTDRKRWEAIEKGYRFLFRCCE